MITILLFNSLKTNSQEVLSGLQVNPGIKRYQANNPLNKTKHYAFDYLLELPFKDDFSNTSVYPDDSLWADKNVFINNTYAVSPPSIGVATFDAFNADGALYNNAGTKVFGADTLTSNHINLEYNSTDSVFFSFYYQTMGHGDYPETGDSLLLDFYDREKQVWHNVKAIPGDTLSDFKIMIFPVTEKKYFKKGFRFRFRNYASLSKNNDVPGRRSNVDHWNIDYVYIDTGRSYIDTVMHDVAVSAPLESLIKNYSAMPWQHFQEAYLTESKSNMDFVYKNNDDEIRHVYRHFKISDNNDNEIFSPLPKLKEPDPFQETSEQIDLETLENQFDEEDSSTYKIMAFLDQQDPNDFSSYNDTIRYTQYFHNYYAYDDGSAEAGYGLMGQGTENAQLAYMFEIKKKDKLQGIRFAFNKSLEEEIVYFYPTVWADNGGKPGNIIHQNTESDSINRQGLNRFHTYHLDSAVDINKGEKIYVGWQQTKNYFMNIGYDVNSSSENNIYYNVSGSWKNSAYKGALMMRPVFGDTLPASIKNNLTGKIEINLYPNPANNYINVDVEIERLYTEMHYSIYSIHGKKIRSKRFEPGYPVNISELSNGLYIFVLSGPDTPDVHKKFIVNH